MHSSSCNWHVTSRGTKLHSWVSFNLVCIVMWKTYYSPYKILWRWVKPSPKSLDVTIGFLNNIKKSVGRHRHYRKISCKYHTIPSMAYTPKDDPMQIDNTQFKPFTKQENWWWCVSKLWLYYGKLGHMAINCPKKQIQLIA
jgi:hypothetical protein